MSPLCSIHLKVLWTKLRETKKKPDTTMSEYLVDVRTTIDALHAAGSTIGEEEIIGYVVDGLDDSYRSFLTHLNFNPTTSFDELVSHLLHEEDLLRRTWVFAANPIAFAAQQTGQTTVQQTPPANQQQHSNYHQNNYRGRFRGGRFNTSGRGRSYYPRAPVYNPPPPNYRHPEHFPPPLLPIPASIGDQICNCAGHTARNCNNKRNFAYNTHLTGDNYSTHSLTSSAPSESSESSWCLSGASNHMTPSLNSFTASQPYQGKDIVMVGNGSQLPILRQGIVSLPTSLGPISIPNLLYVPDLHKNLLSIQSLSRDLNCVIFFDEIGFDVKAKGTRNTIMHGNSGQGLYHLNDPRASPVQHAMACTKVTPVI